MHGHIVGVITQKQLSWSTEPYGYKYGACILINTCQYELYKYKYSPMLVYRSALARLKYRDCMKCRNFLAQN